MKKKIMWIAGIDEAGRGPLAGPVAVGVVVVPMDFDWSLIPNVGDSKKVSPKNRSAIFRRAMSLKKQNLLNYSVTLVSASVIDKKGISYAVRKGIEMSLTKLALNPHTVSVKLDGLLHAPQEFTMQETIIKGDAKEKVIGLASILAKVTRDTCMEKMAQKFPEYGFEVHKGYGTKQHRSAIREKGPSKEHRKSYLRNAHTWV